MKDYIKGKVVKKEFSNGGHILKISIPMGEINRIQKKDWINIEVAEMKEPHQDPKGNLQTHYMVNDDWQAETATDRGIKYDGQDIDRAEDIRDDRGADKLTESIPF